MDRFGASILYFFVTGGSLVSSVQGEKKKLWWDVFSERGESSQAQLAYVLSTFCRTSQ